MVRCPALTRRLVALGLGAVVALLLTPPASHAADEGLPEGDFTAVYTGTTSRQVITYDYVREGVIGPRPPTRSQQPATVRVVCEDGRCAITWEADPLPSTPIAQAPTLARTWTQTGESAFTQVCPGYVARYERTVRVTSAAAALTRKDGGQECSASPAPTHETTLEFTGELTSLDAAGTTGGSGAGSAGAAGAGSAAGRRSGGEGPTASRLATGEAAAPSVLSALPAAGDLSPSPGRSLALVALVVVLVLLIAFPTHLLNSAVETGQERFAAYRRRRRGSPEQGEPGGPATASGRTWATAAGVVGVASLIGAFVDPGFGLNAGSARVLLSLFLALAVETLVVWSLVIAASRRASPGTVAGFHAAPATLVVVVVAVALTRLTGFEPGIVFGLVAGVTFAAAAGATAEGKVALAGAGLGFALALVAWGGYSLLGPAGPGDGFLRVFAVETMSGLAIAGIASLPLALVPLRGMLGHTLFAWSKPVWAAAYALGLVGFFLVLMPMPFSWSEVGLPLRTWVLLYVAYAVTGVVAWAALTRPWERDEVDPSGPADGAQEGPTSERVPERSST